MNSLGYLTRGGSPAWDFGRGLTTSCHKKLAVTKCYMASDFGGFFGMT